MLHFFAGNWIILPFSGDKEPSIQIRWRFDVKITLSKKHDDKTARDKIARNERTQPQNNTAKNNHATIGQNVQRALWRKSMPVAVPE